MRQRKERQTLELIFGEIVLMKVELEVCGTERGDGGLIFGIVL